jgi:hypothetical protein
VSPPTDNAVIAPADRTGVGRLASLLVRSRLRMMRNALRAGRRGRSAVLALIFGVVVAFSYVGLFAQSFSIVVSTVDLGGQVAVLTLVTGAIAFGSLAARAASNEAVRAGSPENEFLLARPISLPAVVAARSLADAVTDPVGALFLLPVLIAASVVWRLGTAALPLVLAIALLMQVGIATLSYATQLAVVRYIPGRRRRMAWTGLRLVAALSLAVLWMLGTYVMRAPSRLATGVAGLAPFLALAPTRLVGAPLAAVVRGEPGMALLGLAGLAGLVGAAMMVTIALARRAGMSGWEEAGAVWADVSDEPPPTARLPTAATKDLRLIIRDRSQLLALIALPVIFIGVQIFGAAGWSWTTGNLQRISWLAYSIALYMATIGPLAHMQAERRAFWILRTVPVPLDRLLAAKGRAWAIIIGGIAAAVFIVLSLSVRDASLAERLGAGLLVTVGAAGMSFVAVAMASGGADLSDDTSSAVGPSTIYAFLFVGGLFNVVLNEDLPTRVAGLVLYVCAGWTYWQAGIERAAVCLDAEAVRERRLRAADGATMVIIYALGGRALMSAGQTQGGVGVRAAAVAYVVLAALVAVGAAIYLARRPRARVFAGPLRSLLIAAGAGACAAAVGRDTLAPHQPAPVAAIVAIAMLGEELIFRGVLQRGIQEHAIAIAREPRAGNWKARLTAAAVSSVVGVAANFGIPSLSLLASIAAVQVLAAVVYALTGRVTAAWLARAVVVGVAAFA